MDPVEPPPSRWRLPSAHAADEYDVVGIGGDLEPGTLLDAYRGGMFPMPAPSPDDGPRPDSESDRGEVVWWSPDPRGVIPLDGFHVSRTLRSTRRRHVCTVDADFDAVIEGCADPARPHGWIDRGIRAAYRRLFDLGWVHSVEAWNGDGELVGGVYGVAIGGLFAGESMFSAATDGSKVALAHLVDVLAEGGAELFDVQWRTDHLATLGCVEIPRTEYLRRASDAVRRPTLDVFARGLDRRIGSS